MVMKSKSAFAARIPEKICIFIKPIARYQIESWNGSKFELEHSFVCPYDSPKETAWKWATQSVYDYATKVTTTINKEDVQVLEIENEEVETVQLIRLDERGEGGRAWKVLWKEYIVDLREEPFCDAIFKNGVETNEFGTFLKGPFVWAVEGSQNKLTVVGSSLYKSIKEYEEEQLKKSGKTKEEASLARFKKNNLKIYQDLAWTFFEEKLTENKSGVGYTIAPELLLKAEEFLKKAESNKDYKRQYHSQDTFRRFLVEDVLGISQRSYRYRRNLFSWRSIKSKLHDDMSFEMIVGIEYSEYHGPEKTRSVYSRDWCKNTETYREIAVKKEPMFKIKMTSDKEFSIEVL